MQIGSAQAKSLQQEMAGAEVTVLDAAALHVREHISYFYHINEELISVSQRLCEQLGACSYEQLQAQASALVFLGKTDRPYASAAANQISQCLAKHVVGERAAALPCTLPVSVAACNGSDLPIASPVAVVAAAL